jgi:hypothetical protein
MIELSCVSVPANPSALVVERSFRRSSDDPLGNVTTGNCGRPADKECGMKESSECSLHGLNAIGDAGKAARAKHARALRRRIEMPLGAVAAHEIADAPPPSMAEMQRRIFSLRVKHNLHEARLIYAEAAARFACA